MPNSPSQDMPAFFNYTVRMSHYSWLGLHFVLLQQPVPNSAGLRVHR